MKPLDCIRKAIFTSVIVSVYWGSFPATAGNLSFYIEAVQGTLSGSAPLYQGKQFCLTAETSKFQKNMKIHESCFDEWVSFKEINMAKGDHSIRKKEKFRVDVDYLMTMSEMDALRKGLHRDFGIDLNIDKEGKYFPSKSVYYPLIDQYLCGKQVPNDNFRPPHLYPNPDVACELLKSFDIFRLKHLAFDWENPRWISRSTLVLPFFLRVMNRGGAGPVMTDYVLGLVKITQRNRQPFQIEVVGFDESQLIEDIIQIIPAGLRDWDAFDMNLYQSVLSPVLQNYIHRDKRLQIELHNLFASRTRVLTP